MVKGAYHRFHCDHIVNQRIHAPKRHAALMKSWLYVHLPLFRIQLRLL